MNKRHANLRLAAANLGPGNRRERINRLACQTAHAALPFPEHDGSLGTRLDTLRKTIQSAGMDIDTTIIRKERRHD